MMGRSRTSGRAGWPANLYTCKDGYKYRNPVTRKHYRAKLVAVQPIEPNSVRQKPKR